MPFMQGGTRVVSELRTKPNGPIVGNNLSSQIKTSKTQYNQVLHIAIVQGFNATRINHHVAIHIHDHEQVKRLKSEQTKM